MKLNKLTMKEAIKDVLDEARAEDTLGPPTDGEIDAYRNGSMPESAHEDFHKRLTYYPEALEKLRRLEDSNDQTSEKSQPFVADAATKAVAWERLQNRIRAEEEEESPAEVIPFRQRNANLIQALLAVACLVLAFKVFDLNEELNRHQAPTTNITVNQIALSVRAEQPFYWKRGGGLAVMFQLDRDHQTCSTYEITIETPAKETYLKQRLKGPLETVPLLLSEDSLADLSEFRVIISGIKNGQPIECGFKDFKARP